MRTFTDSFDSSKFECYPKLDKNEQPWNAADSYLFEQCVSSEQLENSRHIGIINDDSGVLTYLFRDKEPLVTTDSLFAKTSIIRNFRSNNIDGEPFELIDSVGFQETDLPQFDIVLLKIPKSTKYFENQLARLSEYVSKDTLFLVSGMVKHISNQTNDILEKLIGATLVHRVVKKAILFSVTPEDKRNDNSIVSTFSLPELGDFETYSNTFSNGRLDKGTAELLSCLPNDLRGRVLDLGCGYGAISRHLDQNCTDIKQIYGVDISRMAAASTKKNVPSAKVFWSDGAMRFDDNFFDAVVSNPPFHLDTRFSVAMGLRLITQVEKKLKPRGRFIMVANSGLNYKPYLSRYFSKVDVLSSDRKYTVFEAIK